MPQQQGDVLTGDNAADTLRGTAGKDVISALGGDDVVIAGGSGDAVSGGAGADVLMEGAGDGLLVADRADVVLDGGGGIDTVILAPGTTPYTFSTTNMRGIEAIQDAPGADTTIVFDARILASANDDSFLFALGDGTDEVRINNAANAPVTVRGAEVIYDGEVVLRFEGVENLTLTGGDGDSSSVVTQSLSPGRASSTTVRSVSGDNGNTTTVTSVTTETEPAAHTATPATQPGQATADAVAGGNSAAATLAQLLFGGETDTTDLTPLAARLSALLEVHAEAAAAQRAENMSAGGTTTGGDLFSDSLFGPSGLFGLLSNNIAARSEADLAAIA